MMKTTRVADHGLRLTRYGFSNCYLVREEDGFTLVDTSLPGSADAILSAAAAAGAPIRRIILTHAHADHMGSVDALAAKLGTVEVAASGRSLPLLKQPPDPSSAPDEGKVVGASGMKTAVTRVLAEGDRVGSLLVIDTPGHMPGHQSFLDERDGTLYAGDAVVGVGGLCVPGYAPWWFPPLNLATSNKRVALASARKLLGYPINRFATGHMGVRDGGLPLLASIVAKAGA